MRVIVVGMGVQGPKRRAVAGDDVVACVDPVGEADYKDVRDVPIDSYDAALLCVPDAAKIDLITHLLEAGKHILVEKPLFAANSDQLLALDQLTRQKNVVLYTAYNHRFEPHFVRMRDCVEEGRLGSIYACRMFYGNGTARLVRNSVWRDSGAGVLPDLGSHLLDTALFWFGDLSDYTARVVSARAFENRAFDHISFILEKSGAPVLHFETSLLSWRNHFYCDVQAEKGSAHISSLCKWGPSSFTLRTRYLPSGRPDEETVTLVEPDPTWRAEYDHFCKICADPGAHDHGNTLGGVWLNDTLGLLQDQALGNKEGVA